MFVHYVNLKKQSLLEKKTILRAVKKILVDSNFILGKENTTLEKKIKKFHNVNYCALLNSGTDALVLALHVAGIKKGDEVITVSNTFVATIAAITHIGAIPVFVDVGNDQNIDTDKIESKITKRTKCILPVHLTGRPCNMIKIQKIAKKYKLKVIEDAAQAVGAKYNNKLVGTFGDISCFSMHPLKNLNAIGDGGFILTNFKKYYQRICSLRNHGLINRNIVDEFGYVSRFDTLKSAIVIDRLKSLKEIIKKRRTNAKLYRRYINSKDVIVPLESKNEYNVYHTFTIMVKKRDELINFLKKKGINTAIHYPIPVHKQSAYKNKFKKKISLPNTEKQSKSILSLPINQFLTKKEIKYISSSVNNFYK